MLNACGTFSSAPGPRQTLRNVSRCHSLSSSSSVIVEFSYLNRFAFLEIHLVLLNCIFD